MDNTSTGHHNYGTLMNYIAQGRAGEGKGVCETGHRCVTEEVKKCLDFFFKKIISLQIKFALKKYLLCFD